MELSRDDFAGNTGHNARMYRIIRKKLHEITMKETNTYPVDVIKIFISTLYNYLTQYGHVRWLEVP